MKIEIMNVGYLKCNCYLLDRNGSVLIIDPGDDYEEIVKKIGNRKVCGIIITHYHFDHIGAMDKIVKEYKCKVYDKFNLIEGNNKIDNFIFEVIYTPGHKEDLISIYFREEKVIFCGDFIFKNSIGRCDLSGGDISSMLESINKIKNYDREIIIYPGHGDKTTLGYEIDNNIYFRSDVNYF